jgi:hypothetical protein
MSFTTAQLTAIETAIGTGELKVVYEGKEVQYRSMDDLLKARDRIRSELQSSGSITATPRTSYTSRSRD